MNHVLLGKTIKVVYLAEDHKAVKFDLSDGTEVIARCDGDCCSQTYIESFDNPEALLGTVTRAEDVGYIKSERSEDECELIQWYGFTIDTEKGTCTLTYRNESNGYYGGNLSWPDDEYYYGGVYGQNVSKEVWKPLTK